ncbi:MAG: phosphotransferase [Actinomycetota bacterium]|nr:phosphotransferase [Actinomycetota bacterium]
MVRRLALPIPQTAQELSPDWFTDTFRHAGAVESAKVTSFMLSAPSSGEGFTGQTFRVALDWDHPEEGAPAAVLLKFPSPDSGNRGLVEKDGAYDRELDFYERFAADFPVRVPKLYLSVRDPGSDPGDRRRGNERIDRLPEMVLRVVGRYARRLVRPSRRRYLLLTEYIEGARTTTMEARPSEEDLQEILSALARIHAHWWRHPDLCDEQVMSWPTVTQTPRLMDGLYQASRSKVAKRWPDLFTPHLIGLTDWFSDHVIEAIGFVNDPLALLRGDARSDNMLFCDDGLVMVDFGNLSSGRPTFDVSTLLSSTSTPGPEALANFESLASDYHQELTGAGINDYPMAQFRNDLDVCLILNAYLLVLAAAHYHADYSGASLVEIWGSRILDLLPENVPVLHELVTVGSRS